MTYADYTKKLRRYYELLYKDIRTQLEDNELELLSEQVKTYEANHGIVENQE